MFTITRCTVKMKVSAAEYVHELLYSLPHSRGLSPDELQWPLPGLAPNPVSGKVIPIGILFGGKPISNTNSEPMLSRSSPSCLVCEIDFSLLTLKPYKIQTILLRCSKSKFFCNGFHPSVPIPMTGWNITLVLFYARNNSYLALINNHNHNTNIKQITNASHNGSTIIYNMVPSMYHNNSNLSNIATNMEYTL